MMPVATKEQLQASIEQAIAVAKIESTDEAGQIFAANLGVLIGSFILDQRRIADALERIASA
jgi:hypothetical protein